MVTGGSDGIGLAFAKHLAENGFNILIVARNEAKIKVKLNEIRELIGIKNFKTDYIIADFGEMNKISQYKQLIFDEIMKRGIDIGVLCLNAGVTYKTTHFDLVQDKALE